MNHPVHMYLRYAVVVVSFAEKDKKIVYALFSFGVIGKKKCFRGSSSVFVVLSMVYRFARAVTIPPAIPPRKAI